jgi:hypothetical protein
VGRVNEIRGLELAQKFEQDPCHLVWQVNEIYDATPETRDRMASIPIALSSNLIHAPDKPAGVFPKTPCCWPGISLTRQPSRQGSRGNFFGEQNLYTKPQIRAVTF